MKAVCISCFNYYDNRIKYIEKFLVDKGYEVIYIASDFDHVEKATRAGKIEENKIYINTIPYYKNLSLRRLFSHYQFSINTIKEIKRHKPDLVYVMIPPNSLLRHLARYKRKCNFKLICDIYDLWPETFPSHKVKKLLAFPFGLWAGLRDNYLSFADTVLTECQLYQEKLETHLRGMKTGILYLTKEDNKFEIKVESENIDESTVNICYLGSINNIIDISSIHQLLSAINKIKPVTLYIIGDGENREQLIATLQSSNIKVNFLGKIFEEAKKQVIFDKCFFGINMMKDSVCIGLTMKSIDYFQAGLPILNNINGDTAKIVARYRIGFNVDAENMEEVARKVASISREDLLDLKIRTRQTFDRLFSLTAFNKSLETVLEDVIR